MDQTLARGSRHFAPLFPKADWRGYTLGIASVAIAFALRWMLNPLLGEHQPYVTFFAAVAITAMYGSLEGSVLSLVLSVLAVLFFFLPPTSSSQAQELESRIGLVTYTFSAGLICFIGESLRNTRRRMAAEFQARVQAEGELLKHAVLRAVQLLQQAEAPLCGVVLNLLRRGRGSGYSYGSYYEYAYRGKYASKPAAAVATTANR